MVKVVGRDESAVHRITCWSCASVLEYTQVVRQMSEDKAAIESQLERVLSASSEPHLNHIVDSKEEPHA
jgi:hypothetical protein